jgi:hypothetical protein
MTFFNMYLIKFIIHFFNFIVFFAVFWGCANQQAPGGGEEDKIPPKVKILSPAPKTVNFKGKTINFGFNEYIDKRSFQDAFRISPALKGEIEYNWSGNDVEVIFPDNLQKIEPNKTFVINISTTLTDIHGNPLEKPVSFAFSTGPVIDMGSISGKVFNGDPKKTISIFAYKIADNNEYDPTKNIPDYLTETSSEGVYELTNLAPAKYRVIALIDDDRNLLYTNERESFGVLPFDINLPDSANVSTANFYLKQVAAKEEIPAELDYTRYFKDSMNIVYSSVENESRVVSTDQSIFIFFNSHKPSREDIINSVKITGEENQNEKLVFNWKNDSLVELFPAGKFRPNYFYKLTLSIKTGKDSVYNYELKFKTVGKNSFGEIKGSVRTNYDNINLKDYNVKLDFEGKDVLPVIKYSFDSRDTVFAFPDILEAEYLLFSYIDINSNNSYDYGNPFPYMASEPFYIYPQALRVRGGWTVENVLVNFNR